MKRNRFTDEQIVAALRDAEATTVVEAARKHGVVEQTMYRWRKRFAGVESVLKHFPCSCLKTFFQQGVKLLQG
jgi:hypothetical protein